jgi:hypothetical protein
MIKENDCLPKTAPHKNRRPYPKKKKKKEAKAKRAGDMTQVVGHLPSKHEALSLNPSPKKSSYSGCFLWIVIWEDPE